jgi:carbon-monoxide dehydrogenase large subunit
MNVPFDALSLQKFAVGQPVPRQEDPKLLRGEGRYTDDLTLPGQAHAVMVRSRIAHGVLRGVDTEAARAMPGVLAVLTAADLDAAGLADLPPTLAVPNRDGSAMRQPRQPPLAREKVRFVGETIAAVVAQTAAQARDAAEAVVPDIDPLPAATLASAAAAPDAVPLHAGNPGNVALDFFAGDAARVADAFARAAHVTTLSLRNSRIVVCPMEPRAAIAAWDGERYELRVGSQGVFGLRALMAQVMAVPVEQMRILTGNVGGSFGMKAGAYPEYVPLLHAARRLGRPVKWTDDRSESFLSDNHGRDHEMQASLALDADGHILAVRLTGVGNVGAYLSFAAVLPATLNSAKNIIGVYATPAIEVATRCIFSNTTPVGPYRGAGRPEGNYYIERLIDTAAAEMRIDRVELRRRNHIRPEAMPCRTPAGTEYDSGDFPALLDHALRLADWDGFAQRRRESLARGRLRGRGIGQFLEVTAPPTNEMGGIRFEPDGSVTIITGTLDYGQGHASPFAQILAGRLGLPFDRIRLLQGDSDELIAGGGTGGSKSLMASGAAISEAAGLVIERGRKIAAHLLEAAEADIDFSVGPEGGRFAIVGTDRGIGLLALAARLREDSSALPPDMEATLDVQHVHTGAPSAFPNGCHVAEVEVDPETGEADVVRYCAVNDFGVVINPLIVAGQAHGGIVQGIGQALKEALHYDTEGQLSTGSYMDYCLPRAMDVPWFDCASHPVPARTNLLGAKGCGEAGCAGALPAVMNALVDALREVGITHIDMPATPARVWAAIAAATGRSPGRS